MHQVGRLPNNDLSKRRKAFAYDRINSSLRKRMPVVVRLLARKSASDSRSLQTKVREACRVLVMARNSKSPTPHDDAFGVRITDWLRPWIAIRLK